MPECHFRNTQTYFENMYVRTKATLVTLEFSPPALDTALIHILDPQPHPYTKHTNIHCPATRPAYLLGVMVSPWQPIFTPLNCRREPTLV